jgi:hypothetical protein
MPAVRAVLRHVGPLDVAPRLRTRPIVNALAVVMMSWTCRTALASPLPASVDPPAAHAWQQPGWRAGGAPQAGFTSDDGFGLGLAGALYDFDGVRAPYALAVNVNLYATFRAVQSYVVDADLLRVHDWPLRLSGRFEFAATRSSPYCGIVPGRFCREADAIARADSQALTGAARREFVDRYFLARFMNSNAWLGARWTLVPGVRRIEAFASWWGQLLIPGDFSTSTPYPGSLYARTFPAGERGVTSTAQLGVMLDSRDNEPAPTTGVWAEASIRAAGSLTGSDWSYLGFNTTVRIYRSLDAGRDVVATVRLVLDGVEGHVPTMELSRAGGSQVYEFFGGQRAGRGVRLRGILGPARALAQPELRWTFKHLTFGSIPVALTAIAFSDLGHWAASLRDFTTPRATSVATVGGGLRAAFLENLILRIDAGVSAPEGWTPALYVDVGNLW